MLMEKRFDGNGHLPPDTPGGEVPSLVKIQAGQALNGDDYRGDVHQRRMRRSRRVARRNGRHATGWSVSLW